MTPCAAWPCGGRAKHLRFLVFQCQKTEGSRLIVLPQKAAQVCMGLHAWCDMFVSRANLQQKQQQPIGTASTCWLPLSGMLLPPHPPPHLLCLFFFPECLRVCLIGRWGAFKDVTAGWDGNIGRCSRFATQTKDEAIETHSPPFIVHKLRLKVTKQPRRGR